MMGPPRERPRSAGGGTRFEVWAPSAAAVEVVLDSSTLTLAADTDAGTWVGVAPGVGHGDRYRIRLDGGDALADPASGWQPDGIDGPSAVVDQSRFAWRDAGWTGVDLAATVLYELHVGTFTPAGTLDAAIGELDRLAALGVTTIELMPLNEFPGARNWGYDGVFWSAVQHTYGGPEALARFVDAAHAVGLAVVLDVVYNHVGPRGSVHRRFAPYFVATVATPWGDALNVAEAGSDTVRRTILESAVRWIEDFHVDGLRVDAVHAIHDPTARPFLEELTRAVHEAGSAAGRRVLVIAESSDNDPRVVRPDAEGGFGFDAVWDDDVHHALRGRADRGTPRLLLRLHRCRRRGDRDGAPVVVRRALLDLARPPPRSLGRRPSVRALRGVHEQPRPRRQHTGRGPAAVRPVVAPRRRGGRAAVAVHAAAVHGRGVRRAGAVPVLRRPR